MPLLIAHRGLVDGPDLKKENTIDIIHAARNQKYDVEIDIWYDNSSWWLGHDSPQTKIDLNWLHYIDQTNYLDTHHIWIHAKSIATLYELRKNRWAGHVFFHENDPAVITSSGYIWTYPGQLLTSLSVCVLPENTNLIPYVNSLNVYAFCSDYIHQIESNLQTI